MISSEIKEWNEIKDDIIEIKKDPINFVLFEYVDSVIEEIEKQSDILKEKKQAIREAETMLAQINVESDEDEIKKVESFASQVSYSVLEIIDKSKKAIEEKYLILLTKMSEEEQALSEHNKERFERITEIFNLLKINYEKNLNITEQIKMDIDISSPSTVEENTITSEITSPEKIQTIQTEQIKTIATTEETRTSEIITQMSRNLTPLANEKAIEDVSDLLEKSLSSSDREILANGDFDSSKKLIDSKIEKLIKTNEYRQIVNALLYAFLNTVYENSLEKNSSIYELELKDIKNISSILAYGRTTLNIKDIKLNIPNNIDPKSVEKKYEEFNVPLSDEEIEKIKEVLTRYCDDISVDNEVRVEELLKKQSRYLTILLDDSKPEEVKITLIKSFWSLFDSNNDTDLKSEIINNYRQVKLHEEKLKALDDMDSDDFEIDII